jgi:hypothetical protein
VKRRLELGPQLVDVAQERVRPPDLVAVLVRPAPGDELEVAEVRGAVLEHGPVLVEPLPVLAAVDLVLLPVPALAGRTLADTARQLALAAAVRIVHVHSR